MAFITACASSQDVMQLQEDVFKAHTRLLKLEQKLNNEAGQARNKEESTNKNIASTGVQLDRMNSDMERMRGDLDALRVGIKTGSLPGEPQDENSLSGRIGSMASRLSALEEAQGEMLKTMAQQKTVSAGGGSKKQSLSSLDSFNKALSAKKYKEINEEAPEKLKTLSGKSQQELRLIYAESLFRSSKHSDAALVYHELIKTNSLPEKQPYMYLKIADAFRLLKDKEAASVYYKELIAKFPKAEEAGKAQRQLDLLAKTLGGTKKKGDS
jgi:TolA-binding protein